MADLMQLKHVHSTALSSQLLSGNYDSTTPLSESPFPADNSILDGIPFLASM